MKKFTEKGMNRVFKRVLKDLEKTWERHQQGKVVNLSNWGTIGNLEWVLQLMKQFLEE